MAVGEIAVFWILPFVLVFVLIFAILQKSKILGEDKTQIDALIAAVMGAMFVIIPGPHVGYVISFIPWLAVALVLMLVFFLLYGFVHGDLTGEKMPRWMTNVFLVLSGFFIVGLLFYLTPLDSLIDGFLAEAGETFFTVIIFIVSALAIYWAIGGREGIHSHSGK